MATVHAYRVLVNLRSVLARSRSWVDVDLTEGTPEAEAREAQRLAEVRARDLLLDSGWTVLPPCADSG